MIIFIYPIIIFLPITSAIDSWYKDRSLGSKHNQNVMLEKNNIYIDIHILYYTYF